MSRLVSCPWLRITYSLLVGLALSFPLHAAEPWHPINNVDQQPLSAATGRLVEALQFAGAPLSDAEKEKLKAASLMDNEREAAMAIQEVLDPYCVAFVHINPESRVEAEAGPAKMELMQNGWRTFLVKVHNEAGINPQLVVQSPQAEPLYMRGSGARERPSTKDKLVTPAEAKQRFLDIEMFRRQPLRPMLSGLELEYRILQLYSRDAGKREANLSFHVGQGTQDLGFRSEVPLLFDCQKSVEVTLGVKDEDGDGTTAAFTFKDSLGRVYPNPARRLAPDFFFHDQVYRADGETVLLPPGEYTVEVSRGPEYQVLREDLTVEPESPRQPFTVHLKRWIHPAKRNWYSGDHHVHAAGCAHYDSPTEGVGPEDMMRHILGEDLNVGCVLSWGPCWYTQKKFFEGDVSKLSQDDYLMRYDVEVSGFPSSHAGHLCLLRLTEDDYPATTLIQQWPSWTLPVLKWGQSQGGIVGYSHSGWGLGLPDYGPNGNRVPTQRGKAADRLPDYAMPPFNGIGANEYIVTVAHDACDFISAVDTPAIWELNIWYHTLNCGYRARISGETDFPCIYGERVGLGRIYVKLDEDQPLDFDAWVQGVKAGRSYCGDGKSHLIDFRVNDVAVGEPGTEGKLSQLDLAEPTTVKVTCDVAALLAETPRDDIRRKRLDEKPYWHIERSRVGDTRKVPVELVVNGQVAATQEVVADGHQETVSFDVPIERSSWVALRILPSCHTNPVFVEVGGKPIRASRKSAQWCRDAVDVCWNSKKGGIRQEEKDAAKAAYDQARAAYEAIVAESFDDTQ